RHKAGVGLQTLRAVFGDRARKVKATGSGAPAQAFCRQDPGTDEVVDLPGAAGRIEDFGIEAVAPGEVRARGVRLEGAQVRDDPGGLLEIVAKTRPDQDLEAPAEDRGELAEGEF